MTPPATIISASCGPCGRTLWVAYNRHIAQLMAAVPERVRIRVHKRHNLDEIATRAPTTEAEQTLEYFMADYVDHLELHLRQILGADWRAADAGRPA